jgi:WD40 repeat protein
MLCLAGVGCGHTSVSGGVGYQPVGIPVRFSVDLTVHPDGSIAIGGSVGVVTEVGIFSVGANVETNVQPKPDETLLIIRHHVDKGIVDTVYRIATGEDVAVTLDGRTVIDVTNHKVLIDVSKGRLESIVVKNAPSPPSKAQVTRQPPPGSITLVRSMSSSKIQITTLAWSPDGREIADSGQSRGDSTTKTVAEVRRASDGAIVLTRPGLGFYIYNISWAPGGQRIATSDNGCYCVQIWDARTGQTLATANDWATRWVSWSPDGRYFVSSTDGDSPSVWDADSGAQLNSYSNGPAYSDYPAIWAPRGNLIVDGGEVWNGLTAQHVQTYDELSKYSLYGHFGAESWSPGGGRIVSAGLSLVMWSVNTGATIWTQGQIEADLVSWSPNGKYIAWSSGGQGGVVDANSGATAGSFQTPSGNDISALAWSPDSRQIATASNGAIQIWSAP